MRTDVSGTDIQKILVLVDPHAIRHPCVEKAANLAHSFGSTLELYICEIEQNVPQSWAGGTTLAQYRGVVRERRLAMLEALAAPLRTRGIHVLTDTQWSAPFERAVVEHAIRTRADLVVKDTIRHVSPISFAQDDWVLIHHLPMPLLLVRRKEWAEHPLISACVDPSHVAERSPALDAALLSMARSFSRALSGDVSVLHALQMPPHLRGEPPKRAEVEADYERQRAVVLQAAERADLNPEALRFQEGPFPETLIEMVLNEKPDILAVGVAARQKFQEGAGSTASEILDQTDCDLLVLKPPGFVSPTLVTDA
jgi:universal stress protein E